MPSSSGESQGDVRRGDNTSEEGHGDTDDGRVVAEGSACGCGPMGVSSRDERKSRTGDEIGDVEGAGVCLGGIGVRHGEETTSSRSAMSLMGLARTGSTWSAQGIGIGIGGSRGVVIIEVLPSTFTGFMAKGEGTNEFSCPLASKRGGTEIQTFSFSLGIIIGQITRVRTILPVMGSSSSFS